MGNSVEDMHHVDRIDMHTIFKALMSKKKIDRLALDKLLNYLGLCSKLYGS